MEDKNHIRLLRNPEQAPGEELFREILSHPLLQTYKEIQKIISGFGLVEEWRYYQDGKSWLCKITHKKKTIVWISLWENYVKASFFFTDKHRGGIEGLDLDKDIKASFSNVKPIGKLVPLILDMENVAGLDNFIRIIDYKLSLK